jgi:DNA-binding MurR/RpiR family transcriptional regulator
MSSRIAQMCMNDILFTAVANRDYANIEHNLKISYDCCHPAENG